MTAGVLVFTARRTGLNPEADLKNVLSRIAEGQPINRMGEQIYPIK